MWPEGVKFSLFYGRIIFHCRDKCGGKLTGGKGPLCLLEGGKVVIRSFLEGTQSNKGSDYELLKNKYFIT